VARWWNGELICDYLLERCGINILNVDAGLLQTPTRIAMDAITNAINVVGKVVDAVTNPLAGQGAAAPPPPPPDRYTSTGCCCKDYHIDPNDSGPYVKLSNGDYVKHDSSDASGAPNGRDRAQDSYKEEGCCCCKDWKFSGSSGTHFREKGTSSYYPKSEGMR
jgi:hypothetical protein